MGAIITLTSDFGLSDPYVAAMKGVILGINGEARLIDICHAVRPQNIQQAAFIIGTAYPYFPQKTIHLVVVDPGVGTERRALILMVPGGLFVAPDNGVLSHVLQPFLAANISEKCKVSLKKGLKPGAEIDAIRITNPKYFRGTVSPTFHGRDIFAPVAASLSLGVSPGEFGEPLTSVEAIPVSRPAKLPNGSLAGHVIYIDAFGNLITDMRLEDLPSGQPVNIEVKNRFISGLRRTYADGNGLLAIIGSSGYLEIALKGGNAALLLDAQPGDEVRLITGNV